MKARVLTFAIVALLTTGTAHASLAFDTITNATPAGYSGPFSDGTNYAYQSFVVPGTPDFNSVTLSLLADQPGDGGSVLVYLVPDDGSGNHAGMPGNPDSNDAVLLGTILDSALAPVADATPSMVTLTGFKNILKSMSTLDGEYWIALDMSNSSVEWVYNAVSAGVGSDSQAIYTDYLGGVFPADGSAGQGAFEMQISTGIGTDAVPEPASLAVLGASLTALGCIRRRRKAPKA